MQNVNLHLFM